MTLDIVNVRFTKLHIQPIPSISDPDFQSCCICASTNKAVVSIHSGVDIPCNWNPRFFTLRISFPVRIVAFVGGHLAYSLGDSRTAKITWEFAKSGIEIVFWARIRFSMMNYALNRPLFFERAFDFFEGIPLF